MPATHPFFRSRPIPATLLLAALASTACTTTSQPDDRSGVTARVFGGAGFLVDTDLRSSDAGAIADGDASFDVGWLAGGAVGYRFGSDWSADVEMTYRTNDIDRVTSSGPTIDDGDFASLAVLTNVRYYLPVDGRLRPYVGLGAGWVEEIDIDLAANGTETGFSTSGFGAQALLGAEYALTDRLSLDVEGRYFRSFNGGLDGEEGTSIRYDADYDRFEALIGLTWRF